MSFVEIDPPPGVFKPATSYTAKGRFWSANLWRWFGDQSGPVGGWLAHSTSNLSGVARGITTWRTNDGSVWCGVGTNTHLYVMARDGTVSDITPAALQPGPADSVFGGGYGGGLYGAGTYGTPRPSTYQVQPAATWSLDNWGEDLVGCMRGDGTIYAWLLDTSTPAAPVGGTAPSASYVLVTAEKSLMALQANGDPRVIMFSDTADYTDFDITSPTNYARRFAIQTKGELICAAKINAGTLVWSSVDVWLCSFVGFPDVYGFEHAGSGCGIIGPNAFAVTSSTTFWMGNNGFFAYNGYTQPLPCDVQAFIFGNAQAQGGNVNKVQSAKIWALHNPDFGEVTWHYVSVNSDEVDSYVTYNYRENHWTVGNLVRTAGIGPGVFPQPLLVGIDGVVYDHEVGDAHDGVQPYAETGPFELGSGDYVYDVEQCMPDEGMIGDVTLSFDVRMYPMSDPIIYGPYTLTTLTDMRFCGRQVRVKYIAAEGRGSIVGAFRFDVRRRGKR